MKISEQHNLPDIIWILTFVDTRAHARTHTHIQKAVFSTIRLYWVKLFINSCHFSSEPLLECRMSFTTTNQLNMFLEKEEEVEEKKKKKKNTKGFVKHPVPKLCLLLKIYEVCNGQNGTH